MQKITNCTIDASKTALNIKNNSNEDRAREDNLIHLSRLFQNQLKQNIP